VTTQVPSISTFRGPRSCSSACDTMMAEQTQDGRLADLVAHGKVTAGGTSLIGLDKLGLRRAWNATSHRIDRLGRCFTTPALLSGRLEGSLKTTEDVRRPGVSSQDFHLTCFEPASDSRSVVRTRWTNLDTGLGQDLEHRCFASAGLLSHHPTSFAGLIARDNVSTQPVRDSNPARPCWRGVIAGFTCCWLPRRRSNRYESVQLEGSEDYHDHPRHK